MQFAGQSISVVLSGQTDEVTLKLLAEAMRDDIAALDDISQVSVIMRALGKSQLKSVNSLCVNTD